MSYFKQGTNRYGETSTIPNYPKIVGHSILALFILIILFSTFGTVAAGNIGVKTRFGKVVSSVQPGFYVKLPFVEDVISMDVQTQKEQVDAVEAASADLQTVHSNVAVNYHLESNKATEVYQNIGVFAQAGYKLPHVVFWNVSSRNNQAPALAGDGNVTLISGSSQSTFRYAVEGKTPEESMNDILNSERYSVITV